MKVLGIVAEFNPFHKGHAYLINEARRRGATHVAIAMSGAAVQRGEPAICSKHFRAAAAIENGADLVVELPAPFSCSSAKCFAKSAVQILVQLGIDGLAFGSEFDSAVKLKKAAQAVDKLSDSESVREFSLGGLCYPLALKKAVELNFGKATADIISSPNSTLAVEYISALNSLGSNAEIIPIKRVGAAHDGLPDSGYASGSYLRDAIERGVDCGEFLSSAYSIDFPQNTHAAKSVMLYNLITSSRERLLNLPEINEPLADRIIKISENPPPSFDEFLAAVKSRNFTLARIRRSAIQLTLGASADDFSAVPYIRILAFNRKGTEILKRAGGGVIISSSLREIEKSSPNAARIVQLENRAVRLMQLNTSVFENEYTRSVFPK